MNAKHDTGGFTIIELIVSIGIFTVVAVAAVAALTSVIDANRRTRALTEANNNLNFVLQSMVREIRNGFNYGCDAENASGTTPCANGASEFGFIDSSRDEVGYRLSSSSIEQKINNQNFRAITPDQIDITDLQFRVIGSDQNDQQSRVEITIRALAGEGDASSTLNLQTTATQRLLYTPTN
jgi:type II secretory pathway pseudopilin PulG